MTCLHGVLLDDHDHDNQSQVQSRFTPMAHPPLGLQQECKVLTPEQVRYIPLINRCINMYTYICIYAMYMYMYVHG